VVAVGCVCEEDDNDGGEDEEERKEVEEEHGGGYMYVGTFERCSLERITLRLEGCDCALFCLQCSIL